MSPLPASAPDGDAASTAETSVRTERHVTENVDQLFLGAALTFLRCLSYDYISLYPSCHFVKPSLCLLLFYEPPLVQKDCRGDAIGPYSISASRVTAPSLTCTSPVAPSLSAISVLSLKSFLLVSVCCVPTCVVLLAAVVAAYIGVVFGSDVCLQLPVCLVLRRNVNYSFASCRLAM
jgi:hypothetical protein